MYPRDLKVGDRYMTLDGYVTVERIVDPYNPSTPNLRLGIDTDRGRRYLSQERLLSLGDRKEDE